MLGVGREDVVEVAAAEDKDPVEALAADAADPALGVRVPDDCVTVPTSALLSRRAVSASWRLPLESTVRTSKGSFRASATCCACGPYTSVGIEETLKSAAYPNTTRKSSGSTISIAIVRRSRRSSRNSFITIAHIAPP
jgi:hypothetical protein